MSDLTKQITFKLTVDGKEGIAVLDLTTGKFVEAGGAAAKANEQIKKSYQNLVAEALKYDSVTEGNISKLTEYISSQNISIDIIENTIRVLNDEAQSLAVNSEAWKQKIIASTNLKSALGGLIQEQTNYGNVNQRTLPGVNSMRMAVTQFGYVLNDSQMFLVNARMGMMGIANNIPMIVQLFNQARTAAGGTATTMQLLSGAITGGGGLIIGINALMLLMQFLPDLFDDTTEKIGLQADEVKKLKEEYEKLTRAQLQNLIAQKETELNSLEYEPQPSHLLLSGLKSAITRSPSVPVNQDAIDRAIKLNQEINLLREQYRLAGDLSEIERERKDIQEKINSLHNIDASQGPISPRSIKLLEEYNQQLKDLNEKEKQLRDDDDKDKEAERFAENKRKAVEQFIQEEQRRNEAARLAGLTYQELLNELISAEQEYSATVQAIKDSHNQKELDALTTLADYTKFRMQIIKDYADDLKKEMDEIDDELKEFAAETERKFIADEERRQAFEKEKTKFFSEIDSGKFESDPFEKRRKEIDAEEELAMKRAEIFGASEETLTNIQAYYSNLRRQITLDEAQERINSISNSYNQIYDIISANARDEISSWKSKEEKKLEEERRSALSHAHTQAQRQKINEQFDRRREALQQEADKKAQARLETWFNLQKALAIAEISINLAKAIAVEWGKLGGFAVFTQGLIIAALTAQMAAVAAQKFPKGFKEGGRLPKGKAGLIEGTHNELIAPEEDFKTIFKTYSGDLVRTALMDYKNYITINSGNNQTDLSELRSVIDKLNRKLDEGIKAQAVFNKKVARQIYISGSYQGRRGKLG